jgi:hypothetical protein
LAAARASAAQSRACSTGGVQRLTGPSHWLARCSRQTLEQLAEIAWRLWKFLDVCLDEQIRFGFGQTSRQRSKMEQAGGEAAELSIDGANLCAARMDP